MACLRTALTLPLAPDTVPLRRPVTRAKRFRMHPCLSAGRSPGVIKTPLQRHMGWEAAIMNFLGGEPIIGVLVLKLFCAAVVSLERL